MLASDLVLEVRDADMYRVGQVDLGELTDGKFIKRFNAVGAWQLTLPNDDDMAALLKTPGYGIILWLYDQVYMSGPMVNWTIDETRDNPSGVLTVTGVDDMVVLADAQAFPTPGNADVTQQTSSHDDFTGTCEAVMKHYVSANIGVFAPTIRRGRLAQHLAVEVNANRGAASVSGSARFDNLGALLEILNTGSASGLGFDVVQVAGSQQTVFYNYLIRDRRGTIRMDVENDMLDSTQSGVAAPKTTQAIVAGQGQAEARTFLQVNSADSSAAESLWGRRIETFIDQRQTDDPGELTQAGTDEIETNGSTTVTLKVVPADDEEMLYGRDWRVGDRVSVIVDDQPLDDTVTEAIIAIAPEGVRIGATVGDPTGFDWEAAVTGTQRKQQQRLSALERNSETLRVATSDQVIAGVDKYSVVTPATLDLLLPAGSMTMTLGTTAPSGWLLCQGQSVSRTQYPALYLVLGTRFGSASSSTFNLPDMRGRVPVGLNASDGDFDTIGDTGGEKQHTLTVNEMPSHTHTQNSHSHSVNDGGHSHGVNDGGHSHSVNDGGHSHGSAASQISQGGSRTVGASGSGANYNPDIGTGSSGANISINGSGSNISINGSGANVSVNGSTATNQNTGGGQSHNVVQPFLTVNYMVKW